MEKVVEIRLRLSFSLGTIPFQSLLMERNLSRVAETFLAVTLTFYSFVSTAVSNKYKNSILILIELLALTNL